MQAMLTAVGPLYSELMAHDEIEIDWPFGPGSWLCAD